MTKSMHFTQEELALMTFYDRSSREALICSMSNALPHITDLMVADFTADAVEKLRVISDEAFSQLDYTQAYDLTDAAS